MVSNTYLSQAANGTVAVFGELQLDTVGSLHQSIDFKQLPGQTVSIDLSAVTAVDSAGLALCLEWISQARAQDVTIAYEGVPEQLQRLASMNRVEDLFANSEAV